MMGLTAIMHHAHSAAGCTAPPALHRVAVHMKCSASCAPAALSGALRAAGGVVPCFGTSRRHHGGASAVRQAALHGRRSVAAAAAAPSEVIILDFDGVLVDSEPEVSMAGFRAAKTLFPEHVTDAKRDQVLEGLKVTRPVQVSGWETVIMARILAEDREAALKIVHDWQPLMNATLEAWGTDLEELRRVFEDERNAWMDGNEAEWLQLVQPYQNVVSTLQYTELPFYIVSSKAAHRVSRVAGKQLGLDLPADSPRLFAGCIPPNEKKTEAIRQIARRPLVAEGGATMHFVDDRLETVKAVAADAGLRDAGLQVYFAEWGYSTPEERAEAQQLDGVRSITLAQMNELLKWGVLMGVDDGCGDDN